MPHSYMSLSAQGRWIIVPSYIARINAALKVEVFLCDDTEKKRPIQIQCCSPSPSLLSTWKLKQWGYIEKWEEYSKHSGIWVLVLLSQLITWRNLYGSLSLSDFSFWHNYFRRWENNYGNPWKHIKYFYKWAQSS